MSFVSSHIGRNDRNHYAVPEWVHQQVYLSPYLKLMLRNHV